MAPRRAATRHDARVTDVRPQPLSDPAARRREQRGWYWYDWANSTFSTTVVTVILGPYLTSVAKSGAVDGSVQFLWFDLRPSAYFPACVTVSVLLQIFVLPVVGALADRSAHKRELLAGFAYAGATATMLLITVTGGDYRLGGALFIFANLMFGCAIVVYNSFLPDIADAGRARPGLLAGLGDGLRRRRAAAGLQPGPRAVRRGLRADRA